MKDIQILVETEDFIIIRKPFNFATCAINESDTNNALSNVISIFQDCKSVNSLYKPIEYGLIHRIDTVTEGLLLIARNQQTYDFLIQEQKANRITKTYTALCSISHDNDSKEGYPVSMIELNSIKEGNTFNLTSLFRHYGEGHKEVRPVLIETTKESNSKKTYAQKKSSGKIYSTEVFIEKIMNDKALVSCKITNGFRHQVRSHLAWCGLPIIGDNLYSKYKNDRILFYASALEFINPKTRIYELYSIEEDCKKELSIVLT